MEQDYTRDAEDVTALLRVWPDIEQALLDDDGFADLAEAVRRAFRVEVIPAGYPFSPIEYRLSFNVEEPGARQAAGILDQDVDLHQLVRRHTPGILVEVQVRMVSERKPIEGEVCQRVMAARPAVPDLTELPNPEPEGSTAPLIERDGYWLTPIEAPFYEALLETKLTFAVQPWVQGDRRYRPDFIVYWRGRAIVVELDGHEGHKTKEQRRYDAERERWFKARGLSVIRWTGSDVHADAKGCVRQLLEVLRGERATA